MMIEDAPDAFGARVREIRKALGWSQADLARELGHALNREVNPLTVTRVESGKRPVPVPEVVALATVFQMSPAQLMGDQTVDAEQVEAVRLTRRFLDAEADARHALADLAAFVERYPATRDTVASRIEGGVPCPDLEMLTLPGSTD